MQQEVAVVTGASRGIGAAVVRDLVGRGMKVHAVARPSAGLQELATATGATAHGIDVTQTAPFTDLIRKVAPDVLVNNAGILPEVAPFAELGPEGIDQTVSVNLTATLHATQAALASMLERNRGHIVVVGSIAGRLPTTGNAVYAATKAALHMFADVLRLDVLGTAIRVTTVMPGRVETSIYDEALGSPERAWEVLYDGMRPVQPDDVAVAIGAALDMPPNVDVTTIELMPTRQAYGGTQIAREEP